jgi:hypothetical protein
MESMIVRSGSSCQIGWRREVLMHLSNCPEFSTRVCMQTGL